jgi:tripartite-type tricarboxylate transporter receptor subunit TctC
MQRRDFTRALGAYGFLATCGLVRADTWPSKPVRLVVTQATGSGSDVMGRLVATKLSESLGQSVYVENRVGGGGLIGHEFVMRSPPDGYTLLFTSTAPLIVLPAMNRNAKFTLADFAPVASVLRSPYMILAANRPGAPATFAELVRLIKAGNANFSSAGAGTLTHLITEMLLGELGAKATHIPYKGSGQSLNDLMGGQVLFSTDSTIAAGPLVRGGKLRALAVTSSQRLQNYPDVPTMAELGIPALTVSTIGGLYGPLGIPREIVERISRETAKALALPEVRALFAAAENEALTLPPDEMQAQMLRDAPKWEHMVRKLGLVAE